MIVFCKSISFKEDGIVAVRGNNFRIIFWFISKYKPVSWIKTV